MTGILVTGHGTFATGLTSGLKLLAGEPENYETVDFDPEDSIEILTDKIKAGLSRLSGCDSVLILADLAGGSPFNVSIRLKMKGIAAMEVIGGVNLPILLDAYMKRQSDMGVRELAESSLKAGKEQTLCYGSFGTFAGGDEEDEIELE